MEQENTILTRSRLTIRISDYSLSFSILDKTAVGGVRYEPYTVKSGMSMAANLREAFKESNLLLEGFPRVRVLIDTPVLLIPMEELDIDEIPVLYRYSFHGHDNDEIVHVVLPDFSCVAAFSINKDLKLVITDHFKDVKIEPLMMSIWSYMSRRSRIGMGKKLYGYFHNNKLDVFSFDKNRFRFANSFTVKHVKDAQYFLLYVWRQLNLHVLKDELAVFGDIQGKDLLVEELRKFVQKVYLIHPTAEFNRAPITSIRSLPFDLMTLYIKV